MSAIAIKSDSLYICMNHLEINRSSNCSVYVVITAIAGYILVVSDYWD